MEISEIEEILSKIQNMQSIMIAVATREAEIQDIEGNYKKLFQEVDFDLEPLGEDNPTISNPNSFKSLWDWYNYWSSNLSSYADRRKYVYDLYIDLIDTIEQSIQGQVCQDEPDISNEIKIILPENLKILLVKIQELQLIMVTVATTDSSSIQVEEESYISLYQEISSCIRRLQQVGLSTKNPNNFSSLWHWHSYWKAELDGYASRRSFIDGLYESVVIPIQKALQKHRQKATSVEQFTEDLRHRFNKQLSQQVSLINTSCAEVEQPANMKDSRVVERNVQILDSNPRTSATLHASTASSTVELAIDFAIITAIKIERLAVLKCFGINEKEDRHQRGSRTYWRKRLCLQNGKFYEIVVAQSLDTANVNAALLANDMFHHWKPVAVLMVGIAAAAEPEQQLGDLVVGKEIYCYETGKITAEGKLPEPKQIPVDATLLNRTQSLPDADFLILVDRPDGTKIAPKIEWGVIASGEKVIADALERDRIIAVNRKIMAIEMEAYGVIAAAWQSFEQVRCLVIRALCDYADDKKNDEWRAYAAAVAAGYTKHFLLDEPLVPKNTPEISE
jgi:nucleoside phosphorylase